MRQFGVVGSCICPSDCKHTPRLRDLAVRGEHDQMDFSQDLFLPPFRTYRTRGYDMTADEPLETHHGRGIQVHFITCYLLRVHTFARHAPLLVSRCLCCFSLAVHSCCEHSGASIIPAHASLLRVCEPIDAMGQTASSDANYDSPPCGYRVLAVQPRSPAADVVVFPDPQAARAGQRAPIHSHLVSYLDIVTSINGIVLDADASAADAFAVEIKANRGKPVILEMYNIKCNRYRTVQVTPHDGWGGDGLLGMQVRWDRFYAHSMDNVLHVTDVDAGSPAATAGFRAGRDFLLGAFDTTFPTTDAFSDYASIHSGEEVQLFVLDGVEDAVRVVTLYLDEKEWGRPPHTQTGLGLTLATGRLHTMPNRGTTGQTAALVSTFGAAPAHNPLLTAAAAEPVSASGELRDSSAGTDGHSSRDSEAAAFFSVPGGQAGGAAPSAFPAPFVPSLGDTTTTTGSGTGTGSGVSRLPHVPEAVDTGMHHTGEQGGKGSARGPFETADAVFRNTPVASDEAVTGLGLAVPAKMYSLTPRNPSTPSPDRASLAARAAAQAAVEASMQGARPAPVAAPGSAFLPSSMRATVSQPLYRGAVAPGAHASAPPTTFIPTQAHPMVASAEPFRSPFQGGAAYIPR